jgi:hypothetical protein
MQQEKNKTLITCFYLTIFLFNIKIYLYWSWADMQEHGNNLKKNKMKSLILNQINIKG